MGSDRFASAVGTRRDWRRLALSFVLFGGLGAVVVLGAPLLGLRGPEAVARWMGSDLAGPLAPLAAIGGFTVMAFIGAPQFVLIAAAVLAFGPELGSVYSWLGTLVSALVGFALGRLFGARLLSGEGGAVRRFVSMIGRNGFLASLLVRLVPSAPFIVVNMAAGVTPMRVRDFFAGTAIGVLPKIALTAFAGDAAMKLLGGRSGAAWLSVCAALGIWAVAGLILPRWLARRSPGALAAESRPGAGEASGRRDFATEAVVAGGDKKPQDRLNGETADGARLKPAGRLQIRSLRD